MAPEQAMSTVGVAVMASHAGAKAKILAAQSGMDGMDGFYHLVLGGKPT